MTCKKYYTTEHSKDVFVLKVDWGNNVTFTGVMLGCILVVFVSPFCFCYNQVFAWHLYLKRKNTRRILCLHFVLIATLSFGRKTMAFDYERSYSTDFTQITEVKIWVFKEGTLSRWNWNHCNLLKLTVFLSIQNKCKVRTPLCKPD